jgi:hypothetical protein
MASDGFQLSRIYRQGWNAARKLVAEGAVDADAKTGVALNPHRAHTPAQSERWAQGFNDALRSKAVPFGKAGGVSGRQPG